MRVHTAVTVSVNPGLFPTKKVRIEVFRSGKGSREEVGVEEERKEVEEISIQEGILSPLRFTTPSLRREFPLPTELPTSFPTTRFLLPLVIPSGRVNVDQRVERNSH